ncbi:MAG: GNAT family N-acetyltransferase [Acidimicrobiales bacterium]
MLGCDPVQPLSRRHRRRLARPAGFGEAPDHDAYGAWSTDRCVGLASLAVDGDGSAHIGVLVEDSWQRQGAGSALTAVLAGRARKRRLPSLVADVLAHNQFILPLLARIGPITTSVACGGYAVRISLEDDHDCGRRKALGPIGREGKHADR